MSDQAKPATRKPAAMPTRMREVRTHRSHANRVDDSGTSAVALDPEEAADRLLRDLRSAPEGLSTREAARRLLQYGPNTLRRQRKRRWPGELARQFTHPLALLLWLAAGLLLIVGSNVVAAAVVLIIVLNAAFSFVQELQAERAVEELAKYLPQRARVERDGAITEVDATQLVPGDIVLIGEGDRIAADVRLLNGAIEVDMSALTGESVPALRSAAMVDVNVPLLSAHELVFSGTTGRRYRNLRQAVQRTHNCGVTTEVVDEQNLDGVLISELTEVLYTAHRAARTERGFCMNLDGALQGRFPGIKVAIARDRCGRVVAFHRYATAGEGSEVSRDVPFRRPDAPNGVDERLSVDMVAEAKNYEALRLSLAFAAFPEIFDAAHPGPLQRVAYRLIHLLDPLIRLESLYRYLRKFHSLAERRYVVLSAHHIPAALMLLLSLEFMPRPRHLGLTQRSTT